MRAELSLLSQQQCCPSLHVTLYINTPAVSPVDYHWEGDSSVSCSAYCCPANGVPSMAQHNSTFCCSTTPSCRFKKLSKASTVVVLCRNRSKRSNSLRIEGLSAR